MSVKHPITEAIPSVLLIDDSATCRQLVRFHLKMEPIELIEAADGFDGVSLCRVERPDLVLLDLHLPGRDGFETIQHLKQDPRTRSSPVIFLSAATESVQKARGLELGAVDFITKPFDPIELRARVRAALRTKYLQDLLEHRAHLDCLTGLGNRHALDERLNVEWMLSGRRGTSLGVLMADLDRFKLVNDLYGHRAGDQVLRGVSEMLRASVRTSDFVARYGGEEFVVIAPDCNVTGALMIAERFRQGVAEMVTRHENLEIAVTTSVGVAIVGKASVGEPSDILSRADRALYCAKSSGRNLVRSWTDQINRVEEDPPFSAATSLAS